MFEKGLNLFYVCDQKMWMSTRFNENPMMKTSVGESLISRAKKLSKRWKYVEKIALKIEFENV